MRGLRLLGCALLALLCLWLPSAATADDAATVLAPGALAELRLSDAPALIDDALASWDRALASLPV